MEFVFLRSATVNIRTNSRICAPRSLRPLGMMKSRLKNRPAGPLESESPACPRRRLQGRGASVNNRDGDYPPLRRETNQVEPLRGNFVHSMDLQRSRGGGGVWEPLDAEVLRTEAARFEAGEQRPKPLLPCYLISKV